MSIGEQRAGEPAARAVRDQAVPVEPDEVAKRRVGDEPHAAAAGSRMRTRHEISPHDCTASYRPSSPQTKS